MTMALEPRASRRGDVGPAAAAAILTIGIGAAVTAAVATAAVVREDGSGSEECRAERSAAALLAAVNGTFLALLIPGAALCVGTCSATKSACAILTYGALALVGVACLVAPVVATVMFSMGGCTAGPVHATAVAAIAIAWCTLAGGVATATALVFRTVHAVCVDFALRSVDDV